MSKILTLFFVWASSVVVFIFSTSLLNDSIGFFVAITSLSFFVGIVSFFWFSDVIIRSQNKYLRYGSIGILPAMVIGALTLLVVAQDAISKSIQSSTTSNASPTQEVVSSLDPLYVNTQQIPDNPQKNVVSAPIPRPVQVPTADEEKKLNDLEYRLETTREEMKDNRELLNEKLEAQQAEFDRQEAKRNAALEEKRLLAEQKRAHEVIRIEAARAKCISDLSRCISDIPSKISQYSNSSAYNSFYNALKSTCERTYRCL